MLAPVVPKVAKLGANYTESARKTLFVRPFLHQPQRHHTLQTRTRYTQGVNLLEYGCTEVDGQTARRYSTVADDQVINMRRSDKPDSTRSYFRSETRTFVLNGEWFFTTREGEFGPYRSKKRVDAEVQCFIEAREQLNDFQESRVVEDANAYSLSILPMEETPCAQIAGNLALDPAN